MAQSNYYEVKRASVSASSQNANEVVAAVTGSRIRVLNYTVSFSGSVNAKWQSGSTDISGLLYGAANTVTESDNEHGVLETNAGEALNIHLSTGQAVGGHVTYIEVPET